MPRKPRRRGNGLGSIRKRGTTWQIMWRENGRRCYDHAPDEDTAKLMLAKMASDVALGRVGIAPDKADAPTLGKLAKGWLERRLKTHRSGADDASRWKLHLEPRLGRLRPNEVGPGLLREIIEAKLADGFASATCQLLVRLVSTFYSDLVERGLAVTNPAKGLPRSTRRLIRPSHDPRTTPFVEKPADIGRIFRALPEPVNLAYAIGAMAGLRTGEILGLQWSSVDLDKRRIVVSEQIQDGVTVRPKDLDSRVVPIMDGLLPVLKEWHLRTGGQGQVVPPMRGGSRKRLDPHTVGNCFREAIEKLNQGGAALPKLTWYQATRHTFASQWVTAGGSIEKLRELMGHSSVVVTERYAHLRPGAFTADDLSRMSVDFAAPAGKILPLTPTDRGEIVAAVAPARQKSRSVN